MPSPDSIQQPNHVPVLVEEVLGALAPATGDVYIDATAGLGGHAATIAERIGPNGTVVLNDADPSNLAMAEARVRAVSAAPKVVAVRGNFAELPRRLLQAGIRGDVVLADLGFSSNQVEAAERGFSFMRDGPLDMRLDPGLAMSAKDLVASLSEEDLAGLIAEFGEDPGARRIARKVVAARRRVPIETTLQLAEIVRQAVGPKRGGIDPATRTFQALRIAVNDEMGSLDAWLSSLERGAMEVHLGATGPEPTAGRKMAWLAPGARVGVISFHSMEDRRVKQVFARMVESGIVRDRSKGPIEASERELAVNPRARSAKLRVVELGTFPERRG